MDRSDLYTPPKTHNSGAETWWAQVDFVIKYIQEDIAKKIEANHSDRECSFIDPWNYKVYKCSHVKDAAIARGINETN